MATIGSFVVHVGADISSLEGDLKKAERAIAKSAKRIRALVAGASVGFDVNGAEGFAPLVRSSRSLAGALGQASANGQELKIQAESALRPIKTAVGFAQELTKQKGIELRIAESSLENAGDMRRSLQEQFVLQAAITKGITSQGDQTKRASAATKQLQDIWVKAANSIRDALTDTFRDALDGNFEIFKDFGKRSVDFFKDIAADIAKAFVFQPAVNSIFSTLGLSLPRAEGAAAPANPLGFEIFDLGGAFSLGGLLGGGGVLSAGSQAAIGNLVLGLGFGQGAANAVISGLGNAPFGFVGSLAADLLGLGGSGVGGFLGSTAGSLIGGAVGGPVGAALGGFIGSVAAGLFEGKPSVGPNQSTFLAVDAAGNIVPAGGSADNGGNIGAATAQALEIANSFGELIEAIGGTFDLTKLLGRTSAQAGIPGGPFGILGNIGNIPGVNGAGPGDFVITGSDLLAGFPQNQTRQSIGNLGEAFSLLLRDAVASGALSIDENALRTFLTGGAEAVFADAMEAAAKAAETFARAATSLRQTADSALIGTLSPLSPRDQLTEARAQFTRTANLALGGDLDAATLLQRQFTEFINASRAFNASSPAFASDFFAARQTLLDVAAAQEALGAQLIADAVARAPAPAPAPVVVAPPTPAPVVVAPTPVAAPAMDEFLANAESSRLAHSFVGGFAHGGSFKVGGSGGADSQLVSFLASPNEIVSITPFLHTLSDSAFLGGGPQGSPLDFSANANAFGLLGTNATAARAAAHAVEATTDGLKGLTDSAGDLASAVENAISSIEQAARSGFFAGGMKAAIEAARETVKGVPSGIKDAITRSGLKDPASKAGQLLAQERNLVTAAMKELDNQSKARAAARAALSAQAIAPFNFSRDDLDNQSNREPGTRTAVGILGPSGGRTEGGALLGGFDNFGGLLALDAESAFNAAITAAAERGLVSIGGYDISSSGPGAAGTGAGGAGTVGGGEGPGVGPALAHGGIVTRPTFALIGEAGTEAVIPLDGRTMETRDSELLEAVMTLVRIVAEQNQLLRKMETEDRRDFADLTRENRLLGDQLSARKAA